MRALLIRALPAIAAAVLIGVPSSQAAPTGQPPLRLTFIALPKGEATLIQPPGGRVVGLLGAGARGEAAAVVRTLRRRGVKAVEVLIGGSWSERHMGGIPELLSRIPVRSFLYSPLYHKTTAGDRAIAAARARAERLRVGAATLDTTTVFYSPPCQFRNVGPIGPMTKTFARDPRCSLALEVIYDRVSFLSVGDSRARHQQALFKAASPPPDGHILQISGQGTADAVEPSLLRKLKTRVVVIPTPKSGPRPDPKLLRTLARAGVKVYRTDQRGTVTVTTDGRNIDVKTER